MRKNILLVALLIIAGAAGAFAYIRLTQAVQVGRSTPDATFCLKHQMDNEDCPWCNSILITKKGMCPAHRVPEALCSRCNPALIAGFKAENDWCAAHEVPESQCELCRGGHLPSGHAPCTHKETNHE